jgi:hypothetical protein
MEKDTALRLRANGTASYEEKPEQDSPIVANHPNFAT